jgi:hypothetical protein
MADTGWIAVIGAGAAIGGGLITGAFDLIRDWFSRPQLKLEYSGGDDCKVESTWESKGQTETQIFIRVRLSNSGKRIARDCKVYLVGLTEVSNSTEHKTNFYDSMELSWPGYPQNFESRSVPSGIDMYANLVSVSKNQSGWRFQVKQMYASQGNLKAYKGTYRFRLLAIADNAAPAELFVDVHYDQDWHSLRACEAKV